MELNLKTDRLLLKPITEHDFDFIVKLETRPENKSMRWKELFKEILSLKENGMTNLFLLY